MKKTNNKYFFCAGPNFFNIFSVIAFLLGIGCATSNNESELSFNEIKTVKQKTIDSYYLHISDWADSYGPKKMLKNYSIEFQKLFISLESNVTKENSKEFTQNLNKLIKHTVDIKSIYLNDFKFNNIKAFWILDSVQSNLTKMKMLGFTSKKEKIKFILLDNEEKLLSFMYTLGNTDRYVFNKYEPTIIQSKSYDEDNTVKYSIGLSSYDSTKCNKIVFWYEKNGVRKLDSTKCNYMKFPSRLGKVKIGGTYYFQMLDTILPIKFEEIIIIP